MTEIFFFLCLGARKKKKRQREVLTPLPEARQPDEAPEQRSLNEQRDESGEDSHRLQRERAVHKPFLYHLQIKSEKKNNPNTHFPQTDTLKCTCDPGV